MPIAAALKEDLLDHDSIESLARDAGFFEKQMRALEIKAKTWIPLIREARSEGNWLHCREHLHKLSGFCGGVGAKRAHKLAFAIETFLCENESTDFDSAWIDFLEQAVLLTLIEIENFR